MCVPGLYRQSNKKKGMRRARLVAMVLLYLFVVLMYLISPAGTSL